VVFIKRENQEIVYKVIVLAGIIGLIFTQFLAYIFQQYQLFFNPDGCFSNPFIYNFKYPVVFVFLFNALLIIYGADKIYKLNQKKSKGE
jgi:hypothetical protein